MSDPDDKLAKLQQLSKECLEMGKELGYEVKRPALFFHIYPDTGLASIQMYGAALSTTRGGSGFNADTLDRALDMAIEHLEEKRTKLHALCTGAYG